MSRGFRRFLTGALCTLAVTGLTLNASAQSKDEKKRQKELQEALQREARPVLLLIDHLQQQQGTGELQAFVVNPKETEPDKTFTAGTPAVDPATLSWRTDMMKAADGKVYTPYTIGMPPGLVASGPVSVYVRVVPKGAVGAAEKGDRYPFEDYYTVEPRSMGSGSAMIQRAFAAAPGEYDVYVGMRPKAADPKKGKDDPVRVVAFKQTMDMPNYWNGELATSTVVVAGRVEQVQTQVTPEMQRERPYLFGQTEFAPSVDNKFKKTDELSVVFQIYNPQLEAGKPDVTVEYTFHLKQTEGEKYFNKTSPQTLNSQTLPPTFDVVAMQMLPGGQSVPLASFPAGDYRMEIKVTDNLAKKAVTKDVLFSVVGS